MKRVILIFLLSFGMMGFTQPEIGNGVSASKNKYLKEIPVEKGEYLEFKLSYGWFTVGKADLKVFENLSSIENQDCYKVEINGRTAGILGAFSKVDDHWGAYITEDELLPLIAYSDLQEGNYQRKEYIQFDQEKGTITVEMTKRHKKKPLKVYEIEGQIHDLLSGYINLRSIDYRSLKKGDTIHLRTFYDEEFYDFGAIYDGIEQVKTKVGNLSAYKIIPVLPKNKIFPGENPITAWISADMNQLPLQVEANMFFGTAYCELTNYKNIKYGPDFKD